MKKGNPHSLRDEIFHEPILDKTQMNSTFKELVASENLLLKYQKKVIKELLLQMPRREADDGL